MAIWMKWYRIIFRGSLLILQVSLSTHGSENAQLFTAQGKNHAWDMPLFLGDSELNVVEEAWRALDKVVVEARG
ncbi:hypothetical protein ACMFMG_001671 [Clarireedia jacksonii]